MPAFASLRVVQAVKIQPIDSSANISDIATKSLACPEFERRLRTVMNLKNQSPRSTSPTRTESQPIGPTEALGSRLATMRLDGEMLTLVLRYLEGDPRLAQAFTVLRESAEASGLLEGSLGQNKYSRGANRACREG